MSDLKTDEQCDRCKEPFKILVKDFEQIMKDGDSILCPDCETKALDEQTEILPTRICFDYCIIPFEGCDFDAYGNTGWELVTIYDGDAYFKRERFEES